MSWKRNSWNNRYQKQFEWQQKKAMYHRYLEFEQWAAKRDFMLNLVGRKCEICMSDDVLQVHHLTYDRIYHELKSDFVVVCRECHEGLDENRRLYKYDQNYFAHWVHKKFGDDWRNEMSFLDAIRLFADQEYGIKEIRNIFGIPIIKD